MADQLSSRAPSVKWSALFFLGIIVLWQLLLPALKLPSYLLPTPLAIVEEFQKRGGFIFANALPTFYETMAGFLIGSRSEEHTSELQSLRHLVCRLLLEKNNK